MRPARRAALTLSLLLALGAVSSSQELDAVELDVSSGTTARRLPFDVPFLLTGVAPPGSVRVELTFAQKDEDDAEFPSTFLPKAPIATRVGEDGRFRVSLGPFPPDRDFRFRLVFRRRLGLAQAAQLSRSIEPALDRFLEAASSEALDPASVERLREALRDELLRSLGEGQAEALDREGIVVTGGDRTFADDASERDARDALASLSDVLRTREAERRDAFRRLQETAPSFASSLSAIRDDPSLSRLVAALESRPERDPRNPRNPLHLSEGALRLVVGSDAEIAALARGRRLADPGVDLASTLRADEASALRERYLSAARSLRELRDWLQSLVAPGSPNRGAVDGIVAEGALGSAEVEALQRLAASGSGELARAEGWAETLETYAYDLERALVGRGRALEDVRRELEARALAAEVEEAVTTEVLTTRANLYVGLDLGVLYSPELERAAGYVGANVYFAPVNKSASLSAAGGLAKRLSVTFGITVTDIALQDDARIEPLFGSRSDVLVGLGYRFARSLRVSGGTLLVLKNDPNPLVTDRSLAFTPYVAFSFDVDLVGALRSLTR